MDEQADERCISSCATKRKANMKKKPHALTLIISNNVQASKLDVCTFLKKILETQQIEDLAQS
jgi:hypothetical protein